MQTSFGHAVPVYNMERTICDLLRSRKNVEMQVFQTFLFPFEYIYVDRNFFVSIYV